MIRPPLLTILCLCTFVASAFGLYVAMSNISNPEVITSTYGEIYEQLADNIDQTNNDPKEVAQVHAYIESFLKNNTIQNNSNAAKAKLIENLLAILGAILMWGLNKKGFYVYLGASLLAIISPLMLYQAPMSTIVSVGMIFVNAIFVFLYYLNLKHLQ